jgi:DNA-binding LacI/PurR family transcriptional regulator
MNLPNEGAAPAPIGGLPNFGRVLKATGGPMKPITMAGIAKAAGVSQGAISSLLNDRDYGIRVSERTRERVFKVCRELGYVPNDLRAVVRMYPELGDVCLLISTKIEGGLANSFAAKVGAAAMSSLTQGSLVTAFYDETREYAVDSDDLPKSIQNGTASKYLWLGATNVSLCRILQRRGLPMAVIGHETRQPGITSVVPDYVAAGRLAFAQFVMHGHKNIAIVSGPFGTPEPRLHEMTRALGLAAQELGITIDSHGIFHGDLSFEAGSAALDALLARNPETTAVFALSEAAACGIMARAHAKGLSVPKKLSVLALGDSDRAPGSCIPLTTVTIPVDQLALTATRELELQVCQGLPTDGKRIIIGVRLCERASVGPAA